MGPHCHFSVLKISRRNWPFFDDYQEMETSHIWFDDPDPPETSVIHDRYNKLRLKISRLRKRRDVDVKQAEATRKDCVCFLSEIAKFFSTSGSKTEGSLERMWQCVKGIIIHLGNISDDPSVEKIVQNSTTLSQILYHMQLDSLLLAAFCAFQINKFCPQFALGLLANSLYDSPSTHNANFADHVFNFDRVDIIRIALSKFSSAQYSSWFHYYFLEPFSCHCYWKTLWAIESFSSGKPLRGAEFMGVLLFHLSVLRDSLIQVEEIPRQPIEISRSDLIDIRLHFKIYDYSELTIWLLFHSQPKLWLEPDVLEPSEALQSKPNLDQSLCTVLTGFLSSLERQWNESKARFVVSCIYRCQLIAGPLCDSLIKTMEFFLRHLEKSFLADSSTLDQFTTASEDAFDWASKWRSNTIDELDSVHFARNKNSFEIFLQVILWTLGRLPDFWKRLKGRLLSKLHIKFFETLSITGWSHVFDLLLALAGQSPDGTDMSSSLCNMPMDASWMTKEKVSHSQVVWRGLIALVVTYHERKLDCTRLVKKLSSDFDCICRYVKNIKGDPVQLSSTWSILTIYLDAIGLLLTHDPNSAVIVGSLLNAGFGELLQSPLDSSRTSKVLTVIDDLIHDFLDKFPLDSNSFAEADLRKLRIFWINIYCFILPAIKKNALNRTMATAGSVYIALKCTEARVAGYGETNEDSPASIIQYFGYSDDVQPTVSCQFLVGVLSSNSLQQIIIQDASYVSKVLHTWLRCVIELGEHDGNVVSLSRVLLESPDFKSWIRESPKSLVRNFLQLLEDDFDRQTSFEARIALQQKINIIFGDLKKFVDNTLHKVEFHDHIEETVEVVGWIFLYCSRCLYARAKVNNVLRQLADIVLFAAENNQEIFHCVCLHFPSYYCGLFKLDLTNDPQLRELLSAIIRLYLVKFGSANCNMDPFVKATAEATILNASACDFTVHVVCVSFLTSTPSPQKVSIALSFLLKLISSIPENYFKESMGLLFSSSVDICIKGYERTKVDAQNVLTRILTITSLSSSQEFKNQMAQTIRQACISTIRTSPVILFNVLRIISQYHPDILTEVLPYLRQFFSASSQSGPALAIRNTYMDILKNLGQVGQREIEEL